MYLRLGTYQLYWLGKDLVTLMFDSILLSHSTSKLGAT